MLPTLAFMFAMYATFRIIHAMCLSDPPNGSLRVFCVRVAGMFAIVGLWCCFVSINKQGQEVGERAEQARNSMNRALEEYRDALNR